jgi:hypothetical protein
VANRRRLLLTLLMLAPVAYQLWTPPYLGLADNGDFAKVVGRYALKPVDPGPQPTFHFFNRLWVEEESARWVSPYWGIEICLTRAALWLGGTKPFDIRVLGAVHLAVFALAAWVMAGQRWWAYGFAVLAFTDAAYALYFQSFYFDAAALLFGLLLLVAWQARQPWLMTLGALGFALAKGPYAPVAIGLGLLLLWERRRAFVPAALCLVLGGAWMLAQTRTDYKATAFYNLAFFKLGLLDAGSLGELGIAPEHHHLKGTHAFLPESPAQDGRWLLAFYPEGGYGNVLRYYAAHPGVALEVMWRDLREEAKQIRAVNLGNYERATGKRYCTLSTAFGWYSAAKSWLFEVAPWHVLLLYGLALWRLPRTPVSYGVMGLGVYVFGIATLADACETYRHLLLFHVANDVLAYLLLLETQSKRAPRLT